MILLKPYAEIEGIYQGGFPQHPYDLIEKAGRVCYKTDHKISNTSAPKFIRNIIKAGHLSVIEHSAMTCRFVCDTGVTHELVRHRLCAFSQESTRYVNYMKRGNCQFIIPPWCDLEPGEYGKDKVAEIAVSSPDPTPPEIEWLCAMWSAEFAYNKLIGAGWKAEQARDVLPKSTKTEIIVTANFREWLHIFSLRCSPKAHPQMREVMIPVRAELSGLYPDVFNPEEEEKARKAMESDPYP